MSEANETRRVTGIRNKPYTFTFPRGIRLPDGRVRVDLDAVEFGDLHKAISELGPPPFVLDEKKLRETLTQQLNSSRFQSLLTIGNAAKAATKPVQLPGGYAEFHRSACDSASVHHDTTYVYAVNSAGTYGFLTVNGKVSRFRTVGKLNDANTRIGSLVRTFRVGQRFIKNDLINRYRYSGEVAKASVDILEKLGYITKTIAMRDNGRRVVVYERTKKIDGLGFESEHAPVEAHVPPAP